MKKITLIIIILGIITISNAQIEENELKLTPEMEEMLIAKIKNLPETYYTANGIKNIPQLENLHLGKPIPLYYVVNEKLESVSTRSVSRMSDGDSLSLEFANKWNMPVLCDGTPFLFRVFYSLFRGESDILMVDVTKGRMEQFFNYEHKDSIIGSIVIASILQGMDHLIIRKENQDIFVQIYDEVTNEYFKNEYNFNELINHVKELNWREKEARNRYYEKVASKSELELTPEITEMLINQAYSSNINASDWSLSNSGIKERAQLEHLELGKPIPTYRIINENLTFIGYWEVPVMADGEPLFFTKVELEDDGQYRWVGSGRANAEIIHNYEHKDLIIGFLGARRETDYLIIRRENKDICVQMYDYATREYLKNEYSLSEMITAHAQIGKEELKLTPEKEAMMVRKIKNLPEENYSEYGITSKSQLENLHIGKPIPKYKIVNKKSEPVYPSFTMFPISDEESFSLEFTKTWNVPVMSDETPLLFGVIVFSDFARGPFECYPYSENQNIIELFHNYEHKDSIKGAVTLTYLDHGMDYLMIRKENQDIFVEIYDKVTGEYFKNEYTLNELINHLKEAQMRYYAQVANKSELKITPEITEMLDTTYFSRMKNCSDEVLFDCWKIKDRSLLDNLHLGKPIPMFTIVNENLTFTGCWEVPVLSEGEPVSVPYIELDDDGQYKWAGEGYTPLAKIIHNYEHKNLIIGILKLKYGMGYLIIRKDNKDIFVQMYDDTTYEYLKNEYSFSEVLDFLKN